MSRRTLTLAAVARFVPGLVVRVVARWRFGGDMSAGSHIASVSLLLVLAASAAAAPPDGYPFRIRGQHSNWNGFNEVTFDWVESFTSPATAVVGDGYLDPTNGALLVETSPGSKVFEDGVGGAADWSVSVFNQYSAYDGGVFFPTSVEYGIGSDEQMTWSYVYAGFGCGLVLMMFLHVVGSFLPAFRQLARV